MLTNTVSHEDSEALNISHKGLAYRPDIDGLRAVAVLGVLIFHAFPNALAGGFWGVDVFFVISGFLISRIIWDGVWNSRFSAREFYGRRIRRIFPALATVMLTTWGLAYYQLSWDELARVGRHIFSSALFIMNFSLWGEGGYFDVTAERKPLLHLWSLSIEEQFYLIWPLLMWIIGKRQRALGWSLLVFGVGSFAASVSFAYQDNAAAFYNPLGRAWELMLGSGIGYLAMFRREALSRIPYSAPLGLGLIIASFVWLGTDAQYRPALALIPTAGAALVLTSSATGGFTQLMLRHKAMVWVGLISYPLYLWHWPLLSFALMDKTIELSTGLRVGLLGLSGVLATLTYLLLEKPVRKASSRRLVTASLLIIVFMAAGLGRYTDMSNGFLQAKVKDSGSQFIIAGETKKAVWQTWKDEVRVPGCHIMDHIVSRHAPYCTDLARPRVLLWGDSHAASLYPGLKALKEKRSFGITELTTTGCPPFLESSILELSTPHPLCGQINQRILESLPDLDPDVIILHAVWIHDRYRWSIKEVYQQTAQIMDRIKEKAPGARIIVVGPQLRWWPSLPNILVKFIKDNNQMPPKYLPQPLDYIPEDPYSIYSSRSKLIEEPLRLVVEGRGGEYLLPRDFLCEKDKCLTRLGNNREDLFVFDYGHLTKAGSEYLLSRMEAEIFDD